MGRKKKKRCPICTMPLPCKHFAEKKKIRPGRGLMEGPWAAPHLLPETALGLHRKGPGPPKPVGPALRCQICTMPIPCQHCKQTETFVRNRMWLERVAERRKQLPRNEGWPVCMSLVATGGCDAIERRNKRCNFDHPPELVKKAVFKPERVAYDRCMVCTCRIYRTPEKEHLNCGHQTFLQEGKRKKKLATVRQAVKGGKVNLPEGRKDAQRLARARVRAAQARERKRREAALAEAEKRRVMERARAGARAKAKRAARFGGAKPPPPPPKGGKPERSPTGSPKGSPKSRGTESGASDSDSGDSDSERTPPRRRGDKPPPPPKIKMKLKKKKKKKKKKFLKRPPIPHIRKPPKEVKPPPPETGERCRLCSLPMPCQHFDSLGSARKADHLLHYPRNPGASAVCMQFAHEQKCDFYDKYHRCVFAHVYDWDAAAWDTPPDSISYADTVPPALGVHRPLSEEWHRRCVAQEQENVAAFRVWMEKQGEERAKAAAASGWVRANQGSSLADVMRYGLGAI